MLPKRILSFRAWSFGVGEKFYSRPSRKKCKYYESFLALNPSLKFQDAASPLLIGSDAEAQVKTPPAHSSVMTDTIPAGSYLIRHVGTGQVLYYANKDMLTTEIRDEGDTHNRENQTWWIEPIPEQHEFEKKKAMTLYTITQLASGRSLDAPDSKSEGIFYTHPSHGAPWQLWRFVRLLGCHGWYVHVPTTHVDSPACCELIGGVLLFQRVLQYHQ